MGACSYKGYQSFDENTRPKVVRYSIEVDQNGERILSFSQPKSIYITKQMELRLVVHDTISYLAVAASPGGLSTAIPFYEITDTLMFSGFYMDIEKWFCEEVKLTEEYSFVPDFLTISFHTPRGHSRRFNIYPHRYLCKEK